MPLTLANYRSRLNHFLGGDPSSEWSVDDLINEAGRAFVGAHEWKFMERSPATINFTASTAYVDLPSDFETLIHLESTSDNNYDIELVDFGKFAEFQASGIEGTPSGLYATIVHPTQTATTSAPGVPRLLLWPTPESSVTGALRLYYRAGWTTLSTDGAVANIPTYCETALTQFIQAVALGYEEPDGGSVWERLDRIKSSSSFYDLKVRSGLVQPNYGPENNGMIGSGSRIDFISQTPASPS